jgi:hypothetical protein
MILFVLTGLFHVIPLLRSVYAIWRLHRRKGVQTNEAPETMYDWACGNR